MATKPAGPKSGRASKRGAKRRAPFTPTRGGDGGVLPRDSRRWERNGDDVIAGASIRGTPGWAEFEASLEPTADPDDWAHEVHMPEADEAGRVYSSGLELLVPARELPGLFGGERPGRPRRYPPSQMIGPPGHRVSIDSVFDDASASASRLESCGIELGWGSRHCRKQQRWRMTVGDFAGLVARDDARALTQQRTRVEMTDEERELERRASAMLGGVGGDG